MSDRPMESLLELARLTAGAVAVIDDAMRIRYWSQGMEALLGVPGARALGRSCCEVLQAADVFGNPYCQPRCQLSELVHAGVSPQPLELFVHHGAGMRLRTHITVLPVRNPQMDCWWCLYQFHRSMTAVATVPDAAVPVDEVREHARASPAQRGEALTSRELEVLRHLAQGLELDDISRVLSISPVTVRNHIQNVLRKLDAHSRLQAVVAAMKRKLL